MNLYLEQFFLHGSHYMSCLLGCHMIDVYLRNAVYYFLVDREHAIEYYELWYFF